MSFRLFGALVIVLAILIPKLGQGNGPTLSTQVANTFTTSINILYAVAEKLGVNIENQEILPGSSQKLTEEDIDSAVKREIFQAGKKTIGNYEKGYSYIVRKTLNAMNKLNMTHMGYEETEQLIKNKIQGYIAELQVEEQLNNEELEQEETELKHITSSKKDEPAKKDEPSKKIEPRKKTKPSPAKAKPKLDYELIAKKMFTKINKDTIGDEDEAYEELLRRTRNVIVENNLEEKPLDEAEQELRGKIINYIRDLQDEYKSLKELEENESETLATAPKKKKKDSDKKEESKKPLPYFGRTKDDVETADTDQKEPLPYFGRT